MFSVLDHTLPYRKGGKAILAYVEERMSKSMEPCPWGYKYVRRWGSSVRAINPKHRCNVSCHERWSWEQCLEWVRRTSARRLLP